MTDIASLVIKADSTDIKRAESDLNKFNKTASRTESHTKKVSSGFSSMAATVARLAPLMAAAAAAYAGIQIVRVARETEMYVARLKTMTGSLESATQAFDRLNTFARETPYTLQQSIDGFVKLKALGLDPSEQAMKSYGNTAAAMGKSLTQMVEAVADASTNEFERLKEFGIKAKQQGENVTFTFQGVATTVKKSSEEIQQYLMNIGETQFAGAMADQMDTIDGQLSNLSMSFDDLWRVLGNGMGAASLAKQALSIVSTAIIALKDEYKELFDTINKQKIADLNTEWIKLRGEIKRIESSIALYNKLLKDGIEVNEGHTKGIEIQKQMLADLKEEFTGVDEELDKLNGTSKRAASITESAIVSNETYKGTIKAITAEYDDMDRAMDLIIAQFDELDKAEAQKIAGLEPIQKQTEAIKEQAKVIALEVPQAYKNAASSIQSSFTSMFKDIFDGGEDAFDNFSDNLKDMFTTMLAEMATLAIAQPIIMPMVQMMGGAMGLSSGQIGQTTGQLGLPPGSSLLASGNSLVPQGFSLSNFGGAGLPTTQYGAMTGINGQAISSQIPAGGGAFSQGFTGLGAGYLGASMTGNAFSGGLVGAGGLAAMGGIGAMGAGGAGFMAGAGGALAAMGPVGWAALAIGALAGSGAFSGDTDITPDLNIQLAKRKGYDPSNPSGAAPTQYGIEENGTSDPLATYGGRFADFGFSTQHDAFANEADAKQFVDAIQGRYANLENMIFYSFGEMASQEISDAMANFDTGEIKFEDFTGASQFDSMFGSIFKKIFKAVGENSAEDIARYEKVFLDAYGQSKNLEIGVGSVSAIKAVVESGSSRTFEDITQTIYDFTFATEDLDEQMSELAAITQVLALESVNDDFKAFFATVTETEKAAEIYKLGTQLLAVNDIIEITNIALYDYTEAHALFADQVIEGAGGLDALVAKSNYYYSNFFTAEERRNNLLIQSQSEIDAFNDEFEKFGYITLGSNESLRLFIEGLDMTTEAGINAYNAALNIAPTMNTGSQAINNMLAVFDDAMQSISASTDSSIEKWTLQTYNDEEKSGYYLNQADSLYSQLAGSTDVDEIQELTQNLLSLGDSAFNLLSDDEKSLQLGGYVAGAETINSTAQGRIKLAEQQDIDFMPIQNAMQDAVTFSENMKDAAVTMVQAALTSLKAANTEQQVTVTVDEGSEVGI